MSWTHAAISNVKKCNANCSKFLKTANCLTAIFLKYMCYQNAWTIRLPVKMHCSCTVPHWIIVECKNAWTIRLPPNQIFESCLGLLQLAWQPLLVFLERGSYSYMHPKYSGTYYQLSCKLEDKVFNNFVHWTLKWFSCACSVYFTSPCCMWLVLCLDKHGQPCCTKTKKTIEWGQFSFFYYRIYQKPLLCSTQGVTKAILASVDSRHTKLY